MDKEDLKFILVANIIALVAGFVIGSVGMRDTARHLVTMMHEEQ